MLLQESSRNNCDAYGDKIPNQNCPDEHLAKAEDINRNEHKFDGEMTESNQRSNSLSIQKTKYTKGFIERTWRNFLGIRRSSSASSYDVEYETSTRSSAKEDCLSENEDRSDGIDSGIASEEGDRPSSSTLSSSVNFFGSNNEERVPGLCGIHNLGNTCYMNSVLQCLGHIDLIVEYFVMGKYRLDVKQKKRIFKAKKADNIGKGKLTESLANLLKGLWSFGYSRDLCLVFKDAVSKHGEQYRGTAQQDAHEFLLWLLNGIHHDVSKNMSWSYHGKSTTLKKKKHYTDEEAAARTLATYNQQNQSFIKSCFQAQYRSSLVCPECNTSSSTFDPFLCISVPVPQKECKPVYLTLIRTITAQPPRKIGVNVPQYGTVLDLKIAISSLVDIPHDKLILILAYDDGDHCSLKNDSMVDGIPEMDNCIFAIEVPGKEHMKSLLGTAKNNNNMGGNTTPLPKMEIDGLTANFQNRSKFLTNLDSNTDNDTAFIIVTNVEVKGKRFRRFGFPIALRVSRSIDFKNLQILIRREMANEIRNAINKEARNWKLVLGLRIVGGIVNNDYLRETHSEPLRQCTVDRAMRSNSGTGPLHISMVAEWEPETSDWVLAQFGQGLPIEDDSVSLLEEEYAKTVKVNLNDCIELHTKEEELLYEESWNCPNCKVELKKTTKKLCLWSLPDVLIVHLKRFNQANQWKGKIATDVQFPLTGLDMRRHIASRSKMSPKHERRYTNSKKHLYSPPPEEQDCIYDLFSVCNHIGPYMTSGHYTAFCKNSVNGKWYCFDDTEVSSVLEEQICTRSAYLLFYQKRSVVSRSVSLSSLSMSTGSGSNEVNTVQLNDDFTNKIR